MIYNEGAWHAWRQTRGLFPWPIILFLPVRWHLVLPGEELHQDMCRWLLEQPAIELPPQLLFLITIFLCVQRWSLGAKECLFRSLTNRVTHCAARESNVLTLELWVLMCLCIGVSIDLCCTIYSWIYLAPVSVIARRIIQHSIYFFINWSTWIIYIWIIYTGNL